MTDLTAAALEGSLKGHLIVASPVIDDPDFFRTVVLVVDHGSDGAVGVVLNRPSEREVAEPLPAWVSIVADPPVLFVGGPVAPESAVGLGLSVSPVALTAVDLHHDPEELRKRVSAVRVFTGHAAWDPRQLEAEIIAGGWFVVDALPDDPLSPLPEELWSEVLRRQGGRLARLANFPPDPTAN